MWKNNEINLKSYTLISKYVINIEWIESESESRSVVSDSLPSHEICSPLNSPGQNIGVVAFPFSRGSSRSKDWTQVSHIAGRFFSSWATREGLNHY